MRRLGGLFLACAAFVAVAPAHANAPIPPIPDCSDSHLAKQEPASHPKASGGDVRVVAIQYKQDVRYVETYETFRHKMECLIRDFVPGMNDFPRPDAPPTIVVFNEDIGLATIATGTRGAPARAIAAGPVKDPTNIPGAIAAFASIGATHAREVAYYTAKFPGTSPQRLILASATDTFVRGFMQTFSDLAREFGVYVLAANNQPEFQGTSDPTSVAALADPDLADQYASGALKTVYEAVDTPGTAGVGRDGVDIYNTAFMWAPTADTTDYAKKRFGSLLSSASDPRANIVAVNTKTPITSIESQILDLSDSGDITPANVGPFGLLAKDDPTNAVKIGFGISLPAFMWGSPFGKPASCTSSQQWMRCLDEAGVNLFLQPEANPGMWAEYDDLGWKPPAFQSLSWLDSAWRAVADPTVKNIRYAVTPMMTGNLVDLTFDGQSSIFERCLPTANGDTCDGNTARTHVGANEFDLCAPGVVAECDDPALEKYAYAKRETVAMADWVMNDCPLCVGPIADRIRLQARSRAMQAGSGSEFENDYLETAVWADLDFS